MDIRSSGLAKQYTKHEYIDTSWGLAEPSSAKAGAMDSVEIRLKIDVQV